MRAYENIKFIESPDVGDIQEQARKSSVGRVPRGESFTHFVKRQWDRQIEKIKHNDRGYSRNSAGKKMVRRYLKRADKAISAQYEKEAEGNDTTGA